MIFIHHFLSEAGPDDSQNLLVSKYGQGTVGNSDNQHWLNCDADERCISFQLDSKKSAIL